MLHEMISKKHKTWKRQNRKKTFKLKGGGIKKYFSRFFKKKHDNRNDFMDSRIHNSGMTVKNKSEQKNNLMDLLLSNSLRKI